MNEEQKKKPLLSKTVKSVILDIIIAVCIALVITIFIRPTLVKETSMTDTLQPNDYLIVSKQAYSFGEPKRGDIIVFKSELDLDEMHKKNLVKRIVGLPGETIEVRGGNVFIDGDLLEENYTLSDYTTGEVEKMQIPSKHYFVMGDNREGSMDSRDFGTIKYDDIKGKVVLRLYPFDEIRTFKQIEYKVYTKE